MTTPSLPGPDFSKSDGLLPAIAQDAQTGEVLMLAWMNAESFAETVRTGNAVYYSRSRGKLWRKGEESGHVQTVRGIYIDCDADTILLKVDQLGAACHEGYRSCFFRMVTTQGAQVVSERLVEPEEVYRQPIASHAQQSPVPVKWPPASSCATSHPTRPSNGGISIRTCVAIGYFWFLIQFFYHGIPHPATIPLMLLGIFSLMTIAVVAGGFLTALKAQERRQFNLLTLFAFTAACAMMLGTVTGLVRASGHLTSGTDVVDRIMPFVMALSVSCISFPFAIFLAEAFIWSAERVTSIPRVRSIVQRLIP